MFGLQTIYIADPDLTVARQVLNAVAMICKQDGIIWGCALAASLWRMFVMANTASFKHSAAGSIAGEWPAILIPFLLAMTLTNGELKSDVQVESTVNGQVTVVSNVPYIIVAAPALFTTLGQDIKDTTKTAYQNSGLDYSAISAADNGFINPLKVLLTSRTAILKMNWLNSQINSLIGSCLASDAGYNYSEVARLVTNAGNTGATAGQSLSVFDAAGDKPTSIGALLYQASLNQNGMVPDIDVDGNHLVTCFDAAYKVADNINNAIYSQEFSRVVQGAVNATDQPNPAADFSIDSLSRQYLAVRTANMTTNMLAGGTEQANAELINLMFTELVKNDLNCLKTDGANKSACLATAIQANEIERNNIQAAANANESLMYAGQFANIILFVVIGLGPFILMCMMYAGLSVNRAMMTALHMIVWPILIMNVGAEIINGMMYSSVASFMSSIAQNGYISQAATVEVYKNFSMKIGTASFLMASLPILMTTIFGLGTSAAMVRISDSMASRSNKVGDAAAPAAIDTPPVIRQSSPINTQQGIGFFTASNAGYLSSAAISSVLGDTTVSAGNALSNARSQAHVLSEGSSQLQTYENAFRKGHRESTGLDRSTFQRLSDAYSKELSALQGSSTKTGVGGISSDTTTTELSGSVGGELGYGGGSVVKAGVSAGVSGRGAALASDTSDLHKVSEKDRSEALRRAASTVLDEGKSVTGHHSIDDSSEKSLANIMATQRSYSDTLSHGHTLTETAENAVRQSGSFVASTQKIDATQFGLQSSVNPAFQRFNLLEGRSFDTSAANAPYLARARADMQRGGIDRVGINQDGQDALVRFRAAAMLANDPNAAATDRLAATTFLHSGVKAMEGMGLDNAPQTDLSGLGRPTADALANPFAPKAPAPASHYRARPAGSGHKPGTADVSQPRGGSLEGADEFRSDNERQRQKTGDQVFSEVDRTIAAGPQGNTVTRAGKKAKDGLLDW
ncbi:hypothetical protein [Herbaspirillum sp.]|uniref:conjugal transfer protein TraG N-terminal domain-containing protein n=1 Tax=Herbaspirillum sp. TaxID=1890675 RepID=UPI00257A3EAA|nr:hypothetical protein [Herbaspirillum sp.]|tara:strand:+ start:7725 stop:10634 length:2910 start_codon:yes stop_codon:yes gene_type:complete